MQADDWTGCYRDGWQGEIVPEAFCHPAKYSRSLIRRIYQHAREEGWLPPGSLVLDPFGGVALGALDAMHLGLNWCGCELEPRFVTLGQQNIARWNARYSTLPGWGTATLLQGDSRQLAALVGEATTCVSSPPYAQSIEERHAMHGLYGGTFLNGSLLQMNAEGYGHDPANLGNMKPGDFSAVVSSPPYAHGSYGGGMSDSFAEWREMQGSDNDKPGAQGFVHGYGTTPGQLGAMPAGGFEAAACVSSPPYERQLNDKRDMTPGDREHRIKIGRNPDTAGSGYGRHYSLEQDNLGNSTGDTFWEAARTIVEQVYLVLKPGAHAVWVLKAYVRDKKIVDFPDQWRQMCEACGFETLHLHRAWLVEEHGAQGTLEGGAKRKRTERKSFFRRLAESKGSPRIDYEVVLCQVKPLDAASDSGQASACVSSPPYASSITQDGHTPGQKTAGYWTKSTNGKITGTYADTGYGTDPANLGNMPSGNFDGVLKPPNSKGKRS